MVAMKQAAICYGDDPIAVESYHRWGVCRLCASRLLYVGYWMILWRSARTIHTSGRVTRGVSIVSAHHAMLVGVVAKRVTYVCCAEAAASTMTEEQADAFLLQPSQPQSSPARRNVVAAVGELFYRITRVVIMRPQSMP